MKQARARHRDKLVSIEVSEHQAKVVMERIVDIVGFHLATLSTAVPLDQQLKSLAFDCYTQGLLDGAQIGHGIAVAPFIADPTILHSKAEG